ncbi:MAG: hypothetical protein GY842_16830, partial [bacterium]|nr:hypothetical protein [bacterium]
MKRRASERLATGAAALLARLAIAVAALVMALGVCECAARLLLPPRQVV